MARIELIMPKMGESVAEATLVKWCKNIGDHVEADETLLEIATDKVDSEVPSPYSGVLVKKLFEEDAVVLVGAAFGVLETNVAEISNPGIEGPIPLAESKLNQNPDLIEPILHPVDDAPVQDHPEEVLSQIPGMEEINALSFKNKIISSIGEERFYSPLVKQIAKSEGLSREELDRIPGTGLEGRLTKNDLLEYIQAKGYNSIEKQDFIVQKPVEKIELEKDNASPIPNSIPSSNEPDEIIQMDRMRRLISEHMTLSKQVSAHVTSFVEADVTNLVKWRDRIKDDFKNREKENITFTPIFMEAVAKCLKLYPMINVSVEGNSIRVHKKINIGMATALPNGNLIVPVIKNADQLNLLGLTKKVNDLASRARIGKLNPDDTQGGTFTITNVGSFGNLMGTPIINQPQVAILATGAIVKKPAVVESPEGDMIAIRHKLFLSLSYDHRVVDGALGGMFLRKIADELEAFSSDRKI